jgi:dipeptidyl aminopeptidase/acylaminoacyl peptidase
MAGVRKVLAVAALALAVAPSARGAPPIEAYGKLPALSFVSLSPSGERIAMISAADDKRSLMVVTPDGKPVCVYAIGDLRVRSVTWAGEGHVVVTVAADLVEGFRHANYEAGQAFSLDLASCKPISVFGQRHATQMFNAIWGFYGAAELDGHAYGWFSGITFNKDKADTYLDHGSPDLYKVDLTSGDIVKVAGWRQDGDGWLVSPAGEIVAETRYNTRTGDWQVLAGHDGGRMIVAGRADFGGADDLTLGTGPDRMLVATPAGEGQADRDGYTYRDLSLTGDAEKPIPDQDRIRYPLVDPVSHLWIGNILMNDEQDAVLFSPAQQARWRSARKAFPNNIANLRSWSSDFGKLVVYTDGGDDSGTYWFVDLASHKALPIGGAYDEIKPDDVGPARMIQWRAADGLALSGVLTLPPGRNPKSLPLVVLPHGGPEARDYPEFDWWAQAFASRGYAVFQPNFRGSSGYGVALRNAGLGQWGRKMQTDISDGVAELAHQGIVDPKRACIVGGSYGGYAALAGVTVQHGLYRCAVSVAGVADLAKMLEYNRDRAGRPSDTMRYWKAFIGTDADLNAISPVARASDADAPILLIHGKSDIRVPIYQSERMEAALKSAGKPVQFISLPDGDHELSRADTRIQMLSAAVAFVQKHNPAN